MLQCLHLHTLLQRECGTVIRVTLVESDALFAKTFREICTSINLPVEVIDKDFRCVGGESNPVNEKLVFIDLELDDGIRGEDVALKIGRTRPSSIRVAVTGTQPTPDNIEILYERFEAVLIKPISYDDIRRIFPYLAKIQAEAVEQLSQDLSPGETPEDFIAPLDEDCWDNQPNQAAHMGIGGSL